MLVFSFKDDAFFRFFGARPLPFHIPVPADTLLPDNCFTGLWIYLQQLDTPEQQVAALLDFSRPYLKAQTSSYSVLQTSTNRCKLRRTGAKSD